MRIVDDTVEDGVGESRFTDDIVPLLQRQLAGDQDGGVVVSVLDDFHEIAPLIGVETVRAPIVEDQEVRLGAGPEQVGVASVGASGFEFREHSGDAFVEDGEVVAAGLLNKSVRTSMTSVELSLRLTRIAKHSRLYSSRTFNVLKTFPSSVLWWTKS